MLNHEYCFYTISADLARMPHLHAMLGGPVAKAIFKRGATMLAWGNRPLARTARRIAGLTFSPVLNLEDGFIRSVGLGKTGTPPYSILVDRTGLHFDASKPSDIETLLANCPKLEPARQQRVDRLIQFIALKRLDKYNLTSKTGASDFQDKTILIDQVYGDQSIAGSGASARTFLAMLNAALSERAADQIVVKTHPDVINGLARGYLSEAARAAGVELFSGPLAIDDLSGNIRDLWTVCSTMGFEALLRGIPVSTFGMPFYSGWGLTTDRARGSVAESARRRRDRQLTIEQLAAAVFLDYSRYADPESCLSLTPEEAFERLAAIKCGRPKA